MHLMPKLYSFLQCRSLKIAIRMVETQSSFFLMAAERMIWMLNSAKSVLLIKEKTAETMCFSLCEGLHLKPTRQLLW